MTQTSVQLKQEGQHARNSFERHQRMFVKIPEQSNPAGVIEGLFSNGSAWRTDRDIAKELNL